MEHAGILESTKEALSKLLKCSPNFPSEELFYDIAGGIVHKIRLKQRTAISEVIVRGKRDKQNGNWFYFNLSFESSSFIFNNFKTEKLKLRPVCNLFGFTRVSFCQNCILSSDSEANRDGANAEFPFPLFFSSSASFKL